MLLVFYLLILCVSAEISCLYMLNKTASKNIFLLCEINNICLVDVNKKWLIISLRNSGPSRVDGPDTCVALREYNKTELQISVPVFIAWKIFGTSFSNYQKQLSFNKLITTTIIQYQVSWIFAHDSSNVNPPLFPLIRIFVPGRQYCIYCGLGIILQFFRYM